MEQPSSTEAPRPSAAVAGLRHGAVVLALRPAGWLGAMRTARRFAAPHWWRRWPFLPVPDAAWWAMRCEVASGSPQARFDNGEIVEFVRWVDHMRRWSKQ